MPTVHHLPVRTQDATPDYFSSLVRAFELIGFPPRLAPVAAEGYLPGRGTR